MPRAAGCGGTGGERRHRRLGLLLTLAALLNPLPAEAQSSSSSSYFYTCRNLIAVEGSTASGTATLLASTVSACQKACTGNPTCMSLSYDNVSTYCWLKSKKVTDQDTDALPVKPNLKTCYRVYPASTPVGLAISNVATTSAQVAWSVADLGDCVFQQYSVQVRYLSGPNGTFMWTQPAGCANLVSKCDPSCIATGLPPLTDVQFRAQVACSSTLWGSNWSAPSPVVSTQPAPAGQPTNLTVGTGPSSDTTLLLSWIPGNLNQCVSSGFDVQQRQVDATLWVSAAGCDTAKRDPSEVDVQCVASRLSCNTQYQFRVREYCVDDRASSAFSAVSAVGVTLKEGTCIATAGAPQNITLTQITSSGMLVSWVAGAPGDCAFWMWQVQALPENRASWLPGLDVDGCKGLTDQRSTSCTAVGLQSNTAYSFSVQQLCQNDVAKSIAAQSASFARTSPVPADVPSGVLASQPTTSSLLVKWNMPLFNDCDFAAYDVQVRSASQAYWAAASGCTNLNVACSSQCNASLLAANVAYTFRVRVKCRSDLTSSNWSLPTASTYTMPKRANTAYNLTVNFSKDMRTDTTLPFGWTPGTLNNCVSRGFLVQRQTVAETTTWVNATGCEAVQRNRAQPQSFLMCNITNLTCNTEYRFHVQEVCSDANANSLVSASSGSAQTLRGGACQRRAGMPLGISMTGATTGTIGLGWLPGAAGDGNFIGWEVQVRPQDRPEWLPVAGCSSLANRSAPSCTAAGLQSNTAYYFRVREVCGGSLGSDWLEPDLSSAPFLTLLKPADPPTPVQAQEVSSTSLQLVWAVPDLNDCRLSFQSYLVDVRPASGPDGGAWSAAAGCSDLRSSCQPTCVVGGLQPNTTLLFRVRVVCLQPAASSVGLSGPIRTLPIRADPPQSLQIAFPSVDSLLLSQSMPATLTWQTPDFGQCTFLQWQLNLRDVSSAALTWETRSDCDDLGAADTSCVLAALHCGTTYELRMRVACQDALSSSLWTTSLAFNTQRGAMCRKRAMAPVGLVAKGPTTMTLQLQWLPGGGNTDCQFLSWQVRLQKDGTTAFFAPPLGCTNLTSLAATSCQAGGLQDGTAYRFQVWQVCTDPVLNSPEAVSDDLAMTILVPVPEVRFQLPQDGETVKTKPEEVILFFSAPLRYTGEGLLRICQVANQTQQCPAMCTDVTDAPKGMEKYSTARQLAQWVINPALWWHGCWYTLELVDRIFVTEMEPAKQVSNVSWSFSYFAELPRLQPNGIVATTTNITILLSWDKAVQFRCRARLLVGLDPVEPELAAYSDPLPAAADGNSQATVCDLVPGRGYQVECAATLQADPRVKTDWLAAAMGSTLQDANANLAGLQVFAEPDCGPGGQASGVSFREVALSPAFEPQRLQVRAVLVSADFVRECGAGQDANIAWNLQMSVFLQSKHAHRTVVWSDGTVGSLSGYLALASNESTATLSADVTVMPNASGAPPQTYTITFVGLRAKLNMAGVRVLDTSRREVAWDAANKVYSVAEGYKLQVNVTSDLPLPEKVWERVQVNVGPFDQVTNSTTLPGPVQSQTLVVDWLRGVGRQLELTVSLDNAPILTSGTRWVSFPPPDITCVQVEGEGGGCDGTEAVVSATNATRLFVHCPEAAAGCFGTHPKLLEAADASQLLRLEVASAGHATANLCEGSALLNQSCMTCLMQPRLPGPLKLRLIGPGDLLLSNTDLAYAQPSIVAATLAKLPLGGQLSLTVVGDGFPQFEAGPSAYLIPPGLPEGLRPSGGRARDIPYAVPLCDLAQADATHWECQTQVAQQAITQLGCARLSLVIAWSDFQSKPWPDVHIDKPQITAIEADDFEVGEDLRYELHGLNFGAPENDTLAVAVGSRRCVILQRNDTLIVCSASGPLVDSLDALYPRSEENVSDTNVSVQVPVEVRFEGLEGDLCVGDDALVGRRNHSVVLMPCEPGTYRADVRTDVCLPCPRGRAQRHAAPVMSCEICERGSYQMYERQASCLACPRNRDTNASGSTSLQDCMCQANSYLPRRLRDPDLVEVPPGEACLDCPVGASCAGGFASPIAETGYWLEDGEPAVALACTMQGCSGDNNCLDGYRRDFRCEMCDTGHYPDQIKNTCETCQAWFVHLLAIGASILLLVLVFIVTPIIVWKVKRDTMPDNIEDVPMLLCGLFGKQLRRLMYGPAGREGRVVVPEKVPRWRGCARRLLAHRWPYSYLVVGAEAERLFSVIVQHMQLLVLTGGINTKYWPKIAKDVLQWPSLILGTMESLHPSCFSFVFLDVTQRWLVTWSAPYVGFLLFALVVAAQTQGRTRKNVLAMSAGACLHIMFLPHFKVALQVWTCIPQGGSGKWVLELDRTVYCFDLHDHTWRWMAVVTAFDFMVILATFLILRRALIQSYAWNHSSEMGTEQPISVNFAAWWVVGCRGHSVKHKLVLREVRRVKMALRRRTTKDFQPRVLTERSASDLVLPQVLDFQKDLFAQNLADMRTRLNQLVECLSLTRLAKGSSSELAMGPCPSLPHEVEADSREVRHAVYKKVAHALERIRCSWCDKSSFLIRDEATIYSYMWELITLGNKIGIALICVAAVQQAQVAMRAACAWEFVFVVMAVAVEPYEHSGLNTLSLVFGMLLFFILSTVLVLEMEDSYAGPATKGFFLVCRGANIVLTCVFVLLVAAIATVFLACTLRDNILKETLFVMEHFDDRDLPKSPSRRRLRARTRTLSSAALKAAAGSAPASAASTPKSSSAAAVAGWTRRPMATMLVRSRAELQAPTSSSYEIGDEPDYPPLRARWCFASLSTDDTRSVVLAQGVLLPSAGAPLVRAALEAGPGGPLPQVAELRDWGPVELARGGDLCGHIVVVVESKVQRSVEIVKSCSLLFTSRYSFNSSASSVRSAPRSAAPGGGESHFRLRDKKRIGAVLVPARCTLTAVSFVPAGIADHDAERLTPERFLDMQRLASLHPGRAQQQRGRLVLEFERPDTPEDLQLELCEAVVARAGLDPELCRIHPERAVGLALGALDAGALEQARALQLRLVPVHSRQVRVQVYSEPAPELEEILVLTRVRHHWVVRRREVDSRLGLTTEFSAEEMGSWVSSFCQRSAWRTRDGGVVVMQDHMCFDGQICMSSDSPAPEAEDGEDDDGDLDAGTSTVQRIQWQATCPADGTGAVVHGLAFDGMQIRWEANSWLPPGPWLRIVSAEEREGIPGPDNGLWKFVDRFYTEGQGPVPHGEIELELQHQATGGATELLERSRQDAQPTWVCPPKGAAPEKQEASPEEHEALRGELERRLQCSLIYASEETISDTVDALAKAGAAGLETELYACALLRNLVGGLDKLDDGADVGLAWKAFGVYESLVRRLQALGLSDAIAEHAALEPGVAALLRTLGLQDVDGLIDSVLSAGDRGQLDLLFRLLDVEGASWHTDERLADLRLHSARGGACEQAASNKKGVSRASAAHVRGGQGRASLESLVMCGDEPVEDLDALAAAHDVCLCPEAVTLQAVDEGAASSRSCWSSSHAMAVLREVLQGGGGERLLPGPGSRGGQEDVGSPRPPQLEGVASHAAAAEGEVRLAMGAASGGRPPRSPQQSWAGRLARAAGGPRWRLSAALLARGGGGGSPRRLAAPALQRAISGRSSAGAMSDDDGVQPVSPSSRGLGRQRGTQERA